MKIILLIIGFLSLPQAQNLQKQSIYYHEKYIAVNQWKLWVSNHNWSRKPTLWPGGENAYNFIGHFDDFIWAGKINNKVVCTRTLGAADDLRPGRILDNGLPDDPLKERYRVYKIRKGWETLPFGPERDQYEKDYNEWPAEDGAPWVDTDGNGFFTRGIDQPEYLGDEVLWFVANDINETGFSFDDYIPDEPFGLEVQSTTWGYGRSGVMGDVIFRKYLIINKGINLLEDFYLGFQPFIGGYYTPESPNKSLAGCDTTLNLHYTYGHNYLSFELPPAMGVKIVQGPITSGEPSDSAYFKGAWRKGIKNLDIYAYANRGLDYDTLLYPFPEITRQEIFYNILRGYWENGYPIIDPLTGKETKFLFPGDPVDNMGWHHKLGWPAGIKQNINGGHSFISSYGPFNLAPLDTQEVVVAYLIAQGTDALNSVTELKKKAAIIQKAYYLNFQLTPPPPQPKVVSFPQEDKITLWWETNSESYNEEDPLIVGQNFEDTSYTFEGYIIRQHRDSTDVEGKIIAIYDEKNEVSIIEDYVIANGVSVKLPGIFGNNEGLRRYITVEKDVFTNSRLYNGNPYYFSVTSYAYSKESSPSYLESDKKIIEIIPGREKIDYSSPYDYENNIPAQLISGESDGSVQFRIIDPNSLTGDKYAVTFSVTNDTTKYNLINETKSDTLIKNSTDFGADTLHREIIKGFMLLITDNGLDSINRYIPGMKYAVKSVTMDGINLIGNKVEPASNGIDNRQGINWKQNIGYDDYEIRFTEQGSEYYTTGYNPLNGPLRDDPKGKGRVSFEIWNVTKNEKMLIKIFDKSVQDTAWSQSGEGIWEAVYAYSGNYNEPLPERSGTTTAEVHKLGEIKIKGELPSAGAIIRIETFKPFREENRYEVILEKADLTNKETGKENIDKVTVFPNPYYGSSGIERGGQNFVRFAGLPTETKIRIYTIAGVFVRKIEKSDLNQYLDWDLRNESGQNIASGIYIAHLDMPGIGEKILKVAVVMGKEYLNR